MNVNMRGRITTEQKARMVELRRQGLSLAAIAAEVGCSQFSVFMEMRKQRITAPRQERPVLDTDGRSEEGYHQRQQRQERRKRVAELAQHGLSGMQIAKVVGAPYNTVYRDLQVLDITPTARNDEERYGVLNCNYGLLMASLADLQDAIDAGDRPGAQRAYNRLHDEVPGLADALSSLLECPPC